MKLFLVSGASGAVGRAYIESLKNEAGTRCVGISRTQTGADRDVSPIVVDLLDADSVRSAILNLDLSSVTNVYLIHPVGKFKFEEEGSPESDLDGDGIDDEVYKTNVETFTHIVEPLIERIGTFSTHIPLTLCAFGSVSDKHEVLFWQSYTKSKNILRSRIKDLISQKSDMRGLFINVSTTDTGNENKLRPFADHTHWLKPIEIVAESLPVLLGDFSGYKEIDIFRHRPGFSDSYYENPGEILEKWHREMGK